MPTPPAPPEMKTAMLLALGTAQRRGDLVEMKWSQYDGRVIRLAQRKTGAVLEIPAVNYLREHLDGLERRSDYILTNTRGRPWTGTGLSQTFLEVSRSVGIKDLHFHDLRGTAVTMLADAGASVPQIAAGAPYQQARLLEMQSELQALPQFKSVSVIADFDQVRDGQVPVVVEVEENEQKRIQIGLGYSSNTRERVQFGYSDYNVFERGWRFDSLLKLERLEQSLETSVRLPRAQDGWQDGAGFSLKRTDIEGEVTRTGLFELKRERKDGEFERGVNLRYYYSVQELADGVGFVQENNRRRRRPRRRARTVGRARRTGRAL